MSAMPAHPKKITRENYSATLAALWALAMLVEEAPVQEMLDVAHAADVVGAVLDPTLYRENREKSRALNEDTRMLHALLRVQHVMRELRQSQQWTAQTAELIEAALGAPQGMPKGTPTT